jgi:hypothetical protein
VRDGPLGAQCYGVEGRDVSRLPAFCFARGSPRQVRRMVVRVLWLMTKASRNCAVRATLRLDLHSGAVTILAGNNLFGLTV